MSGLCRYDEGRPPCRSARAARHDGHHMDVGQDRRLTDPHQIAEQADMIARAWSPPGAPQSWELTAAQFASLRDDEELLAIASAIAPDRLPALLFAAAATSLILAHEP